MGFVIGGFLALALLVGAGWLVIYLFTHRGESRRWAAEKRNSERARLLRTAGVRLRCEGCGHEFVGPIPEDGCPGCQCAAFVVAAPAEATTRQAVPTDDAQQIHVGSGTGGDA